MKVWMLSRLWYFLHFISRPLTDCSADLKGGMRFQRGVVLHEKRSAVMIDTTAMEDYDDDDLSTASQPEQLQSTSFHPTWLNDQSLLPHLDALTFPEKVLASIAFCYAPHSIV